MDAEKIQFPPRLAVYLLGIVSISLGIVLCKKCGLGISPISCVPYVLEFLLPISFGVLTMLFHFFNTILQIAITRKITTMLLLQFALGALFGQIINFFQMLLAFEVNGIVFELLLLAGSVFFTALGMVLMINMSLVQNPPDGLVHLLAEKTGRELGTVKMIYDICCVVLAVVISLIGLGMIRGFGIATIVSALCVGRLVTLLTPIVTPILQKLPKPKADQQ